ncbi:MAG: toxic anion resistance protein, partial [Dehalococcoidales bacterium]
MVSGDQINPQSEIERIEVGKEIQPTIIDSIKRPQGMSDEESAEVEEQALALVKQLGEANGSKEMELLDNMTNLGIHSQRTASSNLDLLRARVSGYLSEGGPSKEIASSMLDLRIVLDQIDPYATPKSVWDRAYNLVPLFGRHSPVRVLQRIAIRYEPVSRQITTIETRLREGHSVLIRDNIELRKLYEQLEAQQPTVQKNIYLGELLMLEIEKLIQLTTDPMKRERIRAALHDVASRVQDLRTMDEVYLQYFVSIEMSRQNNNQLGQAIERTLTLATNVVIVGLAIQSALIRQRSIIRATQRTREFLGT